MKPAATDATTGTPLGRRRTRHFLTWWAVITLMLVTLGATFGFGLLLLGQVAWIAVDPAQSFHSPWHVVAAVPFGLFAAGGSAWLFGYGIVILKGVVVASQELALERLAMQDVSPLR